MSHTFHVALHQVNKGDHHGCTPKQYRLEMLLLSVFLKSRSGLSALHCWKSTGSSSVSTKHKTNPKNSPEFFAAEANLALWWALESLEGSDVSLFCDCDWKNSLGGEREKGKRESYVGFVGVKVVWEGFFYWLRLFWRVFWKVVFFSGECSGAACCGGKGDFDGVCSAVTNVFSVGGWVGRKISLPVFFCSLFFHFKFTNVSISSGCSPSVFFFPFLFDFFWGWWRLISCDFFLLLFSGLTQQQQKQLQQYLQ